MNVKRKEISFYRVLSTIVLIVLAILFLFPLYWIITGSFKLNPERVPPEWFPKTWSLVHWTRLFGNPTRQPALRWFLNSLVISLLSMVLTLISSSMAGYVLAKKKFTGRRVIFIILILAMALPKQVILVPLMRLMNSLGIYNTLWAVILGSVGWPFGVFLMKQFSQGIPTELIEAAKIDGAGEIRVFLELICHLMQPAFASLAIFTFINTWNDYFLQLVMLTSRERLTIALGIATMQAEMSIDYGLIMAGAALSAIPMILIFVAFQKYFTKGITLGALKG